MLVQQKAKPLVLYAVPPREGHMRPALQITKHLVGSGFDVTVLGTKRWKTTIEAVGAHFSPIIGLWNTLDDPSRWPDIAHASDPAARLAASLDGGFVSLLPSGLESVRYALAAMRRRQSGCQIIILSDTCFSGTLALKLGADLPELFEENELIQTIGIGVVPAFWASHERPPWGFGLEYDNSEKGRTRNMSVTKETWDSAAEDRARWVLGMMGCFKPVESLYNGLSTTMDHPFWDASTVCHDTVLQMCLPSLEFPSSDWPEKIKFAGTLPIKPIPSNLTYPRWFEQIVANSSSLDASNPSRKKIVFVAQGTEVLDHRELIIPTMQALATHPDVLVVACLCVAGATLDTGDFENGELPSNARVVDYFPYDAVLAHADVFVSNSGYGGFQHAVSNGVPMVQAGNTFDKPDIGRRIEWSGLGVFLSESPPSVSAVGQAVAEILGDEKYKRRAGELRDEAGGFDPLRMVEEEILSLSQSGASWTS
ncbi:UDP-glucuronosyl/UDP-glucosyltransferase [Colletotrichum orchidophilum]|uniref:UDP-glucuronosyl/UDP-glucosyltransferase n=1 Tax=Colletotrichum orchidophilum TaxID=1209926 RepID=A0A1G4BNA0_9PEZI|nr:UDP-glucuronosyl/UDP-glucosyltransferase [Colletotrichum orchidophilum]OHF02942.1 UDP-glucuronosyl/UDP-glucosyltransferase [Colletotrichum orchidophilum]